MYENVCSISGSLASSKHERQKVDVPDAYQLTIFLLKVFKVHGRERLKHASETALHTLCALRDTAHEAKLTREKYDYPICFGEVIALKDEALCFEMRHQAKG